MDADTKKFERIKNQFNGDTNGWELIRFPAVKGVDVSDETRDKYFTPKYLAFANDATVGCAMSHMTLWDKAMYENMPFIIIIEDDVVLHENFFQDLDHVIANLPEDFDVVYLNCGGICGDNCKDSVGTSHCKKYDEIFSIPTWSTSGYGYIISPKGVAQLKDKIVPLSKTFDSAIGTLPRGTDFKVYNVTNPILHHAWKEESLIDPHRYGWMPKILQWDKGLIRLPHPFNFYIDLMGCILIVCAFILGVTGVRIPWWAGLSVLVCINFADFANKSVSKEDGNTFMLSIFNTLVPFLVYMTISHECCDNCPR